MKKRFIKTTLKTFLVVLCGAMVVVDSAYSRSKIEEEVTGEVRT